MTSFDFEDLHIYNGKCVNKINYRYTSTEDRILARLPKTTTYLQHVLQKCGVTLSSILPYSR